MKQLQLFAPRDLRLADVEIPHPSKGEVLVRVETCGVCTLEQRLYTGQMKIFYPIVPGHEAAGTVEEIGAGTLSSLKIGDRVALDLVYRCGECYWCRIGKSNHCAQRFAKEIRPLGGFSQYLLVNSKQCFVVPIAVPAREACFAEPLACCIHSLRSINLELAEDLLIIGAGPMGLLHTIVGKAMGARVIVSDPLPSRRELALQLGAHAVLQPDTNPLKDQVAILTEGRGVDACVITAPVENVIRDAVMAVRKGGRVSAYSAYSEEFDLPVDTNYLHRAEVAIVGVEGRTEKDFLSASRFIGNRMIDLTPLISAECSLEEVSCAMEKAMDPTTFRVLFDLRSP